MKTKRNPIDQVYQYLGDPELRLEDKMLTQPASIHYQAKIIRFCAKDCRQEYPDDPLNSSLASRLLTDR